VTESKIIHAAREVNPNGRQVCLAIGFFDGVHLGHQAIIRRTLEDARSLEALAVVVTFDQHPSTIVAPHHIPPLIQTGSQRLRTLVAQGVDAVLALHFDACLRSQSARDFIHSLAYDLGRIRSISVGQNFVFGRNRSGSVESLRHMGAELGFQAHGLPAVTWAGMPISSTRVREAIRRGDLALAREMLGRPWVLQGMVSRGDGLGRQLGFPTANLEVGGLVLPPHGVYAATASSGELAAECFKAVVNIGYRPTLGQAHPSLRVEAHLLDFDGNLYGETLDLTLHRVIRAETKFPSLDALKQQIAIDVAAAR
jgi:riboflavin kinase/FMN adenylyltransferase